MDDEDYDEFYVVFSTSDEKLAKKIDALSDKWDSVLDDWWSGKEADYPTETISFEGKLAPQPTDSDYIKYRDEWLSEGEFSQSDVATYRIAQGKIGVPQLAMFFGGAVVAVVGLIALIASLISGRKAKHEEFY